MLIIFKSKAAADVMMFGDVAERLLMLMGKRFERRGIITAEQLPQTIARLRNAVQENKAEPPADESNQVDSPDASRHAMVSLAARATPLLELLERSLKAGEPVTWGV